jgi:Rrf2 family transcriptional regulator, cysteine metabolism repressor
LDGIKGKNISEKHPADNPYFRSFSPLQKRPNSGILGCALKIPTYGAGMKLSVKVDYACRVLTQLARLHGGEALSHIEELAKIEAVPANYLVQILSELRNGGLITSRRGKQGGYALARPPENITLLDIVKVIEGELLEITTAGEGQSGKRVNQIWREIRTALEEKAKSYTLDKFVPKATEEMYYI